MEDDQSLLGGAGLSSPSFFSAIQHLFYYAQHYCYSATDRYQTGISETWDKMLEIKESDCKIILREKVGRNKS